MYRWLWTYVRPQRIKLLFGLLLTVLAAALALVNAPVSGILVDQVITAGKKNLLLPLLGLMLGCTVLKQIVRFSFQMLFEHASQAILQTIRQELYQRVQAMDMSYFDKTKTGDIMALMTGDMDAIRHFHSWVIYQIFENGLVFVLAIIILAKTHLVFTLVLLLLTPFVFAAAWSLSTKVKPTFGRIREQFSRLNSVVQEYIAGNRVVKAFGREDFERDRFMKENDEYRARNIESAAVWARYIPRIEFFSGCLMVVMISMGGLLIMNDALTVGELVVFSGLVWAITNPLRMSGWLINDFQRFTASLVRVHELASLKPELVLAPNPEVLEKVEGRLEFRDVVLRKGNKNIIDTVSFTLEAGWTLGIVGPTGSGKTTLARLMCRHFDPDEGQILLDGRPLPSLQLQALRREVGMAMQDVFLFSDTLEGNIAFADPEANMDRILQASKLANAHEFISKMPDGYDTIVGERGVGLSGGQRQRVALARLLLAEPRIMILDDTTSAVDVETEEHIQETIRSLHGSHTMVLIAHRLSSVMHADLILVIDEGRIIQRGTHKELSKCPGYYRDVWQHQNGYENGQEA